MPSATAPVRWTLIAVVLSVTAWPLQAASGQNQASPIRALGSYLGCQTAKRALGNAIIDVDQSLLSAIRTAAPSPPVASRDIAMVGIAMYDAVNAATGLLY